MNRKYELVDPQQSWLGQTLYRVHSLKDFENAAEDEYGGQIESESNLSQEGDCWVFRDACVYGNAQVTGDATVSEGAVVFGNARISDKAFVSKHARVWEKAQVYGNATLCGEVAVRGEAEIFGNAEVVAFSEVRGKAKIFGNAQIFGNATVGDNANISRKTDVLCISGLGSLNSVATFYVCADNRIRVRFENACMTLDEFSNYIHEKYKGTFHEKTCLMAGELAKLQIAEGVREEARVKKAAARNAATKPKQPEN